MSSSVDQARKAIPAKLGFLAIYNPSLGTSDDTIENQIVYYSSSEDPKSSKSASSPNIKAAEDAAKREQNNEQLRQIGLAQGMVEFGGSFSDGKAVDTVETEKARIILHELEPGWWILASISLTVLPVTAKPAPITKDQPAESHDAVEYSSREVKPAILLLGDLLRAHATFLLHHASSMSALFVRTRRSKFVGILGRYWDTYISTWNVLMHGNPATSLYSGIKIAACGELGVGVGEEERGSGEREVLEGFIGRIDGLVDVIVSRFGDADPSQETPRTKRKQPLSTEPTSPWLGSGNGPAAEDGAIFLGTGALSRKSVRDVSHWIEDLYQWGPYAYGVTENPSSVRRSRNSRKHENQHGSRPTMSRGAKKKSPQVCDLSVQAESEPTNPDPDKTMITIAPEPVLESSDLAGSLPKVKNRRPSFHRGPGSFASSGSETETSKANKFVQYLKFGYGTHWTLGGSSLQSSEVSEAPKSIIEPNLGNSPDLSREDNARPQTDDTIEDLSTLINDSKGHYLVGLLGDIENENIDINEPEPDPDILNDASPNGYNSRLLLRTLTLELEREEDARAEADISIDLGRNENEPSSMHANSEHTTAKKISSYESQDRNKTKRLRVVVYANRPFIFVFLFELRTDALAWGNLYRSIHHQIAPLIKSLLTSTTFRASRPDVENMGNSTTPIYDLLWDPTTLTVNSNIPNIPDPYRTLADTSGSSPWSRIEALNTHMQIINTYIASTTTDSTDLERTCKTSRGWWVVWTRIPAPEPESAVSLASGVIKVSGLIHEDSDSEPPKLIGFPYHHRSAATSGKTSRRSSTISGAAHPFLDTPSKEQKSKDKEIFLIRRASDHAASRSRMISGSSFVSTDSGWTSGPGKLAQGIGVDTKRYIEGLLNLSR